MAIEKKKSFKPRTARVLAIVFLFIGILLGFFNVPSYFDRFLAWSGIRDLTGFTFQQSLLHFPFRLGLDIQGGTHLVYQADVNNISTSEQGSSMEAVRDVIERRVNLFGVAEPLVQVERGGAEWRLIVELAGIKDINAAIRLIGETPYLEFKEARPDAERDQILERQKEGKMLNEDPYFLATELTGRHLKKTELSFNNQTYQPEITLELTDEGKVLFAELTKKNIGKPLAIYLDGAPISAPVVREEITGGKAQITGDFTPKSAKELVGRLNAGALPVPIKLIAQQSVEASLGKESLERSLSAGIIGFILVAAFMIFWYRLPGLIAILALLLYTAIVLAIFKLIPVTLTAAGIAGFILSIGMAVDANVLIFERLKEELRQDKGLQDSLEEGFRRAWTSIRDSNISSLITSAILYWFGTSVIKGFALTLGIGILISMFSAIWVTRTLLIAVLTKRAQNWKFVFFSGFSK